MEVPGLHHFMLLFNILVFSSFIVYMGIFNIYIVRGEEIRHKNGGIQGIIISTEGRLDRGKDMWVS